MDLSGIFIICTQNHGPFSSTRHRSTAVDRSRFDSLLRVIRLALECTWIRRFTDSVLQIYKRHVCQIGLEAERWRNRPNSVFLRRTGSAVSLKVARFRENVQARSPTERKMVLDFNLLRCSIVRFGLPEGSSGIVALFYCIYSRAPTWAWTCLCAFDRYQ